MLIFYALQTDRALQVAVGTSSHSPIANSRPKDGVYTFPHKPYLVVAHPAITVKREQGSKVRVHARTDALYKSLTPIPLWGLLCIYVFEDATPRSIPRYMLGIHIQKSYRVLFQCW